MSARDRSTSARTAARPRGGRRTFLKSALGALVAPPLAGLALGATPDPARAGTGGRTGAPGPGLPEPGPGLVARRHGAYYLVAGWVLTGADLAALGIPVADAGSALAHDL